MTPRQEVLIAVVNKMHEDKSIKHDRYGILEAIQQTRSYYTKTAKEWADNMSDRVLWNFQGTVGRYLRKGKILDISDFK